MLANCSMPHATVVPELAYPDVASATEWLCAAYGFTLRLRIANHRAQLNVGDGAVVLTALPDSASQPSAAIERAHAVMVRIADVDAHHQRAVRHGATILRPPADQPYGERQYTSEDLAGHIWTFSQSIADVAPEAWGGTSGLIEPQ